MTVLSKFSDNAFKIKQAHSYRYVGAKGYTKTGLLIVLATCAAFFLVARIQMGKILKPELLSRHPHKLDSVGVAIDSWPWDQVSETK